MTLRGTEGDRCWNLGGNVNAIMIMMVKVMMMMM